MVGLKTNIQLTEEKKLELINQFTPVNPLYDDSAKAYYRALRRQLVGGLRACLGCPEDMSPRG
jgi:hypothetical protein